MGLDEKTVALLPLARYRAGESVISAESKTARLLILKTGEVAILRDSIEIARVEEHGAVLGEISALLGLPPYSGRSGLKGLAVSCRRRSAAEEGPDDLAARRNDFAQRLLAADKGLVELTKQIEAGQSPSVLRKTLKKVEEILSVGGDIAPGL